MNDFDTKCDHPEDKDELFYDSVSDEAEISDVSTTEITSELSSSDSHMEDLNSGHNHFLPQSSQLPSNNLDNVDSNNNNDNDHVYNNFLQLFRALLVVSQNMLNANVITIIHRLVDAQEALLRSFSQPLGLLAQDFNRNKSFFSYFSATSQQMFEGFGKENLLLQRLHYERILSPCDLNKMEILHERTHIQMVQLELHVIELNQISQSQQPFQPAVRLLIEKQPFPMIFHKDHRIKDGITARFITGSQTYPISVSPITATLVCGNATVSLESENGNVLNKEVKVSWKFPCGTKKRPANIKLETTVQMGPFLVSVNAVSNPLIVIANVDQWRLCAQTLFRNDAFGDLQETSWPQFVNTLQKYFIGCTHQTLDSPQRPLSLHDIQYIHSRYFKKNRVTQKEFEEFWETFGKILSTLSHHKSIREMWKNGMIYGFMTRAYSESLVSNYSVGTFVIRFADHSDDFIIDCHDETKVIHYLFHVDQLYSEWIHIIDKFTHILQLRDPANLSFNLISKTTALPSLPRRSIHGGYLRPPPLLIE